jgi:hypothetical protein
MVAEMTSMNVELTLRKLLALRWLPSGVRDVPTAMARRSRAVGLNARSHWLEGSSSPAAVLRSTTRAGDVQTGS